MVPFRLYTLAGCPWCEKAKEFLAKKAVPWQEVQGPDPIINAGLAVMFPNKPAQFPILVAFHANEATVGFKEENFERLVSGYNPSAGTSVPDASANAQLPA